MSDISFPPMLFPEREELVDCGPWCEPLHMIERVVGSHPDGHYFDVDDFMICGKLLRRGRPDIFLYKHGFTRRYLNVDEGGHTYRYFPPRSERGNGQYRRHRDVTAAIDALRLWSMASETGARWAGRSEPEALA